MCGTVRRSIPTSDVARSATEEAAARSRDGVCIVVLLDDSTVEHVPETQRACFQTVTLTPPSRNGRNRRTPVAPTLKSPVREAGEMFSACLLVWCLGQSIHPRGRDLRD